MNVANKDIIRKITKRILTSDPKRNFFIIAAIALTTFMIASVFSVGVSFIDSIKMREKRLQGSVSNMAFAMPTEEQLKKVYTLDTDTTYRKRPGLAALFDRPARRLYCGGGGFAADRSRRHIKQRR